jgi:hypothetical protein
MYEKGRVVAPAAFSSWIAAEQKQFAPATKNLGPYEKRYFPAPQRRA